MGCFLHSLRLAREVDKGGRTVSRRWVHTWVCTTRGTSNIGIIFERDSWFGRVFVPHDSAVRHTPLKGVGRTVVRSWEGLGVDVTRRNLMLIWSDHGKTLLFSKKRNNDIWMNGVQWVDGQ